MPDNQTEPDLREWRDPLTIAIGGKDVSAYPLNDDDREFFRGSVDRVLTLIAPTLAALDKVQALAGLDIAWVPMGDLRAALADVGTSAPPSPTEGES